MSGKCHSRYSHWGHQDGRLPSFFEGRSSFLGRSRRGPPVATPLGAPFSNKEEHSDDEIFWEIEDYVVEAEREEHVQADDPPLYVLASDVWWYEEASSSGGARPSTSRAPPTDSDSKYICKDWVSGLSTKKLGFISREYRLGHLARWAAGNERPQLPPRDYMTFSEAILKTGVFLPLHPFIVQVLDYFDIVPFSAPPKLTSPYCVILHRILRVLWYCTFSFTLHLYTGLST